MPEQQDDEQWTCDLHKIQYEGECPVCAAGLDRDALNVLNTIQKGFQSLNGDSPPPEPQLQCAGCIFHVPASAYGEMEEHLAGTGHGTYTTVMPGDPLPQHGELFAGPVKVYRQLRTHFTPEHTIMLHQQLAEFALQIAEQKEQAELAKKRAVGFEAEMQKIIQQLRDPWVMADVACEWVVDRENGRKVLTRTDTNLPVETKPLSQEDRAWLESQGMGIA